MLDTGYSMLEKRNNYQPIIQHRASRIILSVARQWLIGHKYGKFQINFLNINSSVFSARSGKGGVLSWKVLVHDV